MWQPRQGMEHNYIDGRTHVHHVHFYNSVTGGEHQVQLLLGPSACGVCGRPFEQSDLGSLDPLAETQAVLINLKANHDHLMAYIKRHGVPVMLGPLAHQVPDNQRHAVVSGNKMLLPPRLQHILEGKI